MSDGKGVEKGNRGRLRACYQASETIEGPAKSCVKESHKAAEKEHGDKHHDGGVIQFLVLSETLFFRVPRPVGFFHLEDNLVPVGKNAAHVLLTGVLIELYAEKEWQARRDSNPQPTVLETATLPIELLTCLLILSDVVTVSKLLVKFATPFGEETAVKSVRQISRRPRTSELQISAISRGFRRHGRHPRSYHPHGWRNGWSFP